MGCMSSRAAVAPSESSSARLRKANNNNNNSSTDFQDRVSTARSSLTSAATSGRRPIAEPRASPEQSPQRGNSKSSSAARRNPSIATRGSATNALRETNAGAENSSLLSNEEYNYIMNDNNTTTNGNNNSSSNNAVALRESARSVDQRTSNAVVETADSSLGGGGGVSTPGELSTNVAADSQLDPRLLEEYLFVEYDITHLEDKEPLRHYHDKIEQLEGLESELDMISAEVVSRGGVGDSLGLARNNSIGNDVAGINSLRQRQGRQLLQNNLSSNSIVGNAQSITATANTVATIADVNNSNSNSNNNNNSRPLMSVTTAYSSVEEIFNRKIILEKQRDKLKKEIEALILECDKLQQKYKKRDEILDKLFDGQTGNGLENHLEQQLNWLLQQKHYVDQVFYAWKRAETLTSQSCEQLATALEQLRQLPKAANDEQRKNFARSIKELLQKSHQDLEHAQRYNPEVEAPFFNGNETQRFDHVLQILNSIIEGDSSQSSANSKGIGAKGATSLSQTEYSQLLSITQFAHKRSTNIRLWLEQILQTTIARDSFELAEEYKWIAIQLRKERINLVKLALRQPTHAKMVHAVRQKLFARDQLARQQQQQQAEAGNGSQRLQASSTVSLSRVDAAAVDEANGGDGSVASGGNKRYAAGRARQSTNRGKAKQQALATTSSSAAQQNGLASPSPDGYVENWQQPNNGDKQTLAANLSAATVAPAHNSRHKLRDSGNESEPTNDIDIGEEIYRLLEERRNKQANSGELANGKAMGASDEEMRGRIRRREQRAALNNGSASYDPVERQQRSAQQQQNQQPPSYSDMMAGGELKTSSAALNGRPTVNSRAPSSLKVSLNEEERKSLQRQVKQSHAKHRSQVEKLRGTNRAKAASVILNKMQGRLASSNSSILQAQ